MIQPFNSEIGRTVCFIYEDRVVPSLFKDWTQRVMFTLKPLAIL